MQLPQKYTLKDGTEVILRTIQPTDKSQLQAGLSHLSNKSVYFRFLQPIHKLNSQQLQYLTEVDHTSHEAIVALLPASNGEPETGVGIARYVKIAGHEDLAEAAITVLDDWQGRGLGRLLGQALISRARENGIHAFRAFVAPENTVVIQAMDKSGALQVSDLLNPDHNLIEFSYPIDKPEGSTALTKTLKALSMLKTPGNPRKQIS